MKGERAREVRENCERERYCFELLKKSHDSSPRHPKVAQANKQTERERELRNQSQIDRLEGGGDGKW